MSAPAKFLFDVDFAAPDKSRDRPTQAELAQKVAEAESHAYRAGFEAAQHEARVESDRRAALALEEIGLAIKGIASRFSNIEARMETEAVDVAVAVARKLCTELVARERIEQMAKRSGFEGRLVILAEPEIAKGDCRIEWADGGVVLERAAIEAKVNELVGRYMASRGQAGRP